MSKGYGKGALLGASLAGMLVGFGTAVVVLEPGADTAAPTSVATAVTEVVADLDEAYGEVVPHAFVRLLHRVLTTVARAGCSSGDSADCGSFVDVGR